MAPALADLGTSEILVLLAVFWCRSCCWHCCSWWSAPHGAGAAAEHAPVGRGRRPRRLTGPQLLVLVARPRRRRRPAPHVVPGPGGGRRRPGDPGRPVLRARLPVGVVGVVRGRRGARGGRERPRTRTRLARPAPDPAQHRHPGRRPQRAAAQGLRARHRRRDGLVRRGRRDQPVRLDGRPPRARCARRAARPRRPARQPDQLRCPAPRPGAAGVRRGARPGAGGERVRRGRLPR
jgi:hypothetical protein